MSTEKKKDQDAVDEIAQSWKKEWSKVHDRIDAIEGKATKAEIFGGLADSGPPSRSPYLGKAGRIHDKVKREAVDYDPASIRVGALAMAMVNPEAKGDLTPDEVKVFTSATASGGGLLLPSGVSSYFIDAARPATAVLRAGAFILPMENASEVVPGIKEPLRAGWRTPDHEFYDGGGSFRAVKFQTRDCGALVDLPPELLEDSGDLNRVDDIVVNELTAAIAESLDLSALVSMDSLGRSGPAVPIGLVSPVDGAATPNNGVPMPSDLTGTNGAAPSWDQVIRAAGVVAAANHTPTAHVMAPRTSTALGLLKESGTGAYVRRPDYLSGVTDYITGQLPLNLEKGTEGAATISIVGDFTKMAVGFRPTLGLLRDPYTGAGSRSTRIVAWVKADVGVLDTTGFCVIDGLKAGV